MNCVKVVDNLVDLLNLKIYDHCKLHRISEYDLLYI